MRQVFALAFTLVLGCAAHAPDPRTEALRHDGPFERVALSWDDPPAPSASAPAKPWMTLTTSDGTGLELVSYRAKAVADGPLAFTELHLEFHNREPRVMEGTFRIALPDGASVSRFAMKIGGAYQEGEVVELDTARRTYESYMHRRVDPALLEQSHGNEFRARVFPIAAGEVKELILSYTEDVSSARDPYRLRLRGLPQVDTLEIELLVPSSRRAVEVKKRHFTPDRDFVFAYADPAEESVAVRRGRLAIARVTPGAASSAAEPMPSAVILFDTSASRAPDFQREVGRLGELVEALKAAAGSALWIDVACFDQEVAEIYDGPASGFGPHHLGQIAQRKALGASDLEGALRWAGQRSKGRVVVITDGVATAGAPDQGELARLAARSRIDVLLAGSVRDPALVERIVSANGQRPGIVAESSAPAPAIAKRLSTSARPISIRVPGSAWSWPAEVPAVAPGQQVLVHAELPDGAPLHVDTGSGPVLVRTLDAPAPLVERTVARARIAELSKQREALRDEDERSALRRKIVGLSTKHRVLTPFTGFLVLETEADYARFGLDRRALDDILTVGPEGVALAKHPDPIESLGRDGSPQGTPMAPQVSPGDRDNDGIRDEMDACPSEPGPPDPNPQRNGCPRFVMITSNELRILRTVQFTPGGTTLLPASFPLLDEVAQVLKTYPEIKKLAIEGHTDNQGAEAMNVRISEARANAVRAYLIRAGVAADRLVVKGWGSVRPIDDNRKLEGRIKNRRVEFRVLEHTRVEPTHPPPLSRPALRSGKPARARSADAPQTGKLGHVLASLRRGDRREALAEASLWRDESPSDTLALLAFGQALDAAGQGQQAARAYGSLIDLHPSVADMRRYAGALLESVAPRSPAALALAVRSYRSALEQRKDHPSSHRALAYALLRAGEAEQAFQVLAAARRASFARERFPAIDVILQEDLGLAAAAWTRAAPQRKDEIAARARQEGAAVPDKPSLRVSLSWETDASDLDLHVADAKGADASHARPLLPSGGQLLSDVTEGYGPEVFVIDGEPKAFPYRVEVQSYRRGPTGHGLGSVEIVRHDGQGRLAFETRPFVIMTEGASVDLGVIEERAPR